jgi:nicotinamidase-related amidase
MERLVIPAALAALVFALILPGNAAHAADPSAGPWKDTALIVIDVQNDYFPGGRFELEGAEAAARQARAALDRFRLAGLPVVHVRHESLPQGAPFFLPGTPGAEIHPLVAPREGEPVVLKHYPNSFRETELSARLESKGIKRLVVAGMMTLMCVDATARAARDAGYEVIVLHDACAARALSFQGETIPAAQVHGAFLAALGMSYAKVLSTGEFLALLPANPS